MSGTAYTNIYIAPSIAITTNPANNIIVGAGEGFTISAGLTGGYNVAAQTIHAATTTAGISFSNNDCALNSQNSYHCTIEVDVESGAVSGVGQSVTLSNSTTPSMTLTPNMVTFEISAFSWPYGITLNSVGTFAFITNNNSDTITQCSVNGGI